MRRRAAEADGLIEFGARVRFRHPLVRSAAYWSASADDRKVCTGPWPRLPTRTDPDRRAWHRAHATRGGRGCRRRTRTVGRARPGPRWPGGGGGVPGPGRGADARSGEAGRARPGRGAGQLRPARRRRPLALLAVAQVGPLDELQRAGGPAAGPARVRLRSRARRPPAVAHRCRAAGAPRSELARDTYLDAWAAGCSLGLLAGGRRSEVSLRSGSTPRSLHRAVRPAARRPRAVITEGRAAGAPLLAGGHLRRRGGTPPETGSAGCGWPRPPLTRCGTTKLACGARAASALAREPAP